MNNQFLVDSNLSWCAKGILSFLEGKNINGEFNIKEIGLLNEPDFDNELDFSINQLVEVGYLIKCCNNEYVYKYVKNPYNYTEQQ